MFWKHNKGRLIGLKDTEDSFEFLLRLTRSAGHLVLAEVVDDALEAVHPRGRVPPRHCRRPLRPRCPPPPLPLAALGLEERDVPGQLDPAQLLKDVQSLKFEGSHFRVMFNCYFCWFFADPLPVERFTVTYWKEPHFC